MTLCKDVYLIEGALAHVVNTEGQRVHSFSADATASCTLCSREYRAMHSFSKGVVLRSARVMATIDSGFCSVECRNTWWRSGSDQILAPVHRPSTLVTHLCPECQPSDGQIGIGEICTRVDGVTLRILNKSGDLLRSHSISDALDCGACANERIRRPAPFFYYADTCDADWVPEWSGERFDRDFRATVYELNPGQFQLWEVLPGQYKLRMDRVVEQRLATDPHQINAWWMAPSTALEEEGLREAFELAKRAA